MIFIRGFDQERFPEYPEEILWHEGSHSYSLTWTVPDTVEAIPGNNYYFIVTAQDPNSGNVLRSTISNEFTITRHSGLAFTTPSDSTTYHIGGIYRIRWDTLGEARGRRIILKLMNGEAPLYTIATVDANVGNYTWHVPGLCDGTTPITGRNLRLRITTVRERSRPIIYHVDSAPIEVRMPSFSFDDWGRGLPRV